MDGEEISVQAVGKIHVNEPQRGANIRLILFAGRISRRDNRRVQGAGPRGFDFLPSKIGRELVWIRPLKTALAMSVLNLNPWTILLEIVNLTTDEHGQSRSTQHGRHGFFHDILKIKRGLDHSNL